MGEACFMTSLESIRVNSWSNSWRDQVLKEFTPQVARLTLVADPDGLLLEEGILHGIRERGFELIPFEDHVAFRYAYESKFRSRWDHGEHTDLVVVLRSPSSDLDSLPFDLLQAGRRLSFNLGDLFPNLSYPVVAALDAQDLDALFRAQIQHTPGNIGDNATKEFALRHVFKIAPELIKQPSDLLRVLLRRHYRGQRIPAILDQRFIQVLRQNGLFEKWPLDKIISDREAFFTFMQERWPAFLDRMAAQGQPKTVSEDKAAYLSACDAQAGGLQYSGPLDLPFDHDDVRVYIDNLFIEGLLHSVSHDNAGDLTSTWVEIGIQTDSAKDRQRRLDRLIETIRDTIPSGDARHADWFRFGYAYANFKVMSNEDCGLSDDERIRTLEKDVDDRFLQWVEHRYAGLVHLPATTPAMLHHIPRFMVHHSSLSPHH